MAKTVADQLVDMLIKAGVKRVYAITGDSLNPVNDAIRRNGKIEWIHVRHEEVAAYAASMDAELNGIGCCMGSSGPGHVHLVNGLYDANHAGNPVIAIASTCPTFKFGQDYFQSTNPYFLFKDCSKYIEVANTPQQFTHMMQGALQAAVSQKGVAVVGLPGDVAAAPASDEVTCALTNYPSAPLYRPTDNELDILAKVLNSNKKVMLYCGHGCQNARESVLKLAEVLKAPIGYTLRGKIFMDSEDNPYRVGLNGMLGYRACYEAAHEADVFVMLGCDFPFSEFLPHGKTIIQIDRDPSHLGRRAQVTYGFAGDITDTITALLPRLTAKTDDSFLTRSQQAFKKSTDNFNDFIHKRGEVDRIQPEYVAHMVDELAADDAILTVDTGMTSVWAARFIRRKKARYLTGSFNHGSMANAMPMAIGAALSSNRQVVAMCGDGGLSMLMGDLATIMQYKLPIKIVVFNNRALGMVKLEMEVAGLVDWQTDMVDPPFEKVAEAMGIKGLVAHQTSEVESVLKEAFATDGPVLVNIYTDSDAMGVPAHPTLDEMKGFFNSMMKKFIEGQYKEVVHAAESNLSHLKELL